MTATRIARAGRIRFFIGLGVLVLTMGFVAMFHSSQQQLDESRRMEIRCEQQQEALNIQIEVLESKLKSERLLYEQLKQNLEREAREQTKLKEKSVQEINLKFESLQQQYKFLISQVDDKQEEYSKVKSKQQDEISSLQSKIKSLRNQNDQSANQKDKDIKLWQEKYNQLLSEKQILEKNLPKSSDAAEIQLLKKEIEEYKQHTAWRPEARGIVGPTPVNGSGSSTSTKPSIEKSFNAQIAVSDNLYEIPIKYTNNTKRSGDGFTKTSKKQSFKSDTIINSVENFQFVPKPLANADALALLSSSKATTPSSNRKTSESNGNNKLNIAPNAPMPEQSSRSTSTTVANKKLEENKIRKHPLPQGVVPFQGILDDISVKTLDKPDAERSKTNDNNRYQNVIDEVAAAVVDNAQNSDNVDPMKELHNANGDKDTGAREVNDSNDFVVDEHNHHGHLDHRNDIGNDAAEEDLNLYEINKHKKSIDKQVNAIDIPNGSDDDLQVIHRANGNNDDDNHIPLNGNKLKNEVDQDQGKYPDDVHLEQVEDEDDDEYTDHLLRNQNHDPAIRARR